MSDDGRPTPLALPTDTYAPTHTPTCTQARRIDGRGRQTTSQASQPQGGPSDRDALPPHRPRSTTPTLQPPTPPGGPYEASPRPNTSSTKHHVGGRLPLPGTVQGDTRDGRHLPPPRPGACARVRVRKPFLPAYMRAQPTMRGGEADTTHTHTHNDNDNTDRYGSPSGTTAWAWTPSPSPTRAWWAITRWVFCFKSVYVCGWVFLIWMGSEPSGPSCLSIDDIHVRSRRHVHVSLLCIDRCSLSHVHTHIYTPESDPSLPPLPRCAHTHIQQKWWRVLTASHAHFDPFHLLFNVMALWSVCVFVYMNIV